MKKILSFLTGGASIIAIVVALGMYYMAATKSTDYPGTTIMDIVNYGKSGITPYFSDFQNYFKNGGVEFYILLGGVAVLAILFVIMLGRNFVKFRIFSVLPCILYFALAVASGVVAFLLLQTKGVKPDDTYVLMALAGENLDMIVKLLFGGCAGATLTFLLA